MISLFALLWVVVSLAQGLAVLSFIASRTGFHNIRKGLTRRIPTLVILLVLVVPILQLALTPPIAHASASSSFSFAAAGDYDNLWGSSGETSKVVTGIAGSGSSFALALGDLAYSDIASTDQAWCVNYKNLFNNVVVVAGNHDSGESGMGHMDVYNQACPFSVLGVPLINGTITDDLGTSYGYEYAFDYPATNPIARIILIVPQITWACCGLAGTYSYAAGTANYNWVSARVDEAKARGEWVMVGWHKTKGDVSSALWNLMFQKNVDLVMVGHDHVYKRTYQLNCGLDSTSCIANTNLNTYQKGAGLVYVVQGTGGAGLTTVSPDVIIPPGAEQGTQHGFMKYTVTTSSLSGQFVSVDGTYTDSFTLSSGTSPLATSFTVSPVTPGVGQTVTFTGSATGGTPPYSFAWNFGDGSSQTGTPVTHSYSSQGNYTVTLTATDANPTTATSSRVIAVKTQTSYTFTPTDDTYVEQDTPTTNYGTSTEIIADSSPVKNILLKFNIQISGQVTSATLRLFQVDSSDKGGDFHTTPANWTETTATWNNAPAPNPTIFFSLGAVTLNVWYNITMTTVVTGSGIVSLRVTSSSPTGDGSHFASKERSGGTLSPQLVVITTPSSSNVAPTLTIPTTRTVDEQTPLSFTVSATDDPSQTVTLSALGLPSGSSFASTPATGTATGSFTWTPSEAQGPGIYTVTFRATDNLGAMRSGNVSISVNEVNQPPVIIVPGPQSVAVGTTLNFTVTATDPDVPSNVVTLSASGLVAGMSFNSSTGLFLFTPTQSQRDGTFNVAFSATDNGTPPMSNVGTVTMSVTVTPPSLTVPGSQTVNEQTSINFTISATDDANRTITLSCGNCGSLGAVFTSSPGLGAASASFSWSPTEAQGPGTYSFSFTAANDLGGFNSKTVTITVSEVNLPPALTVPGNQRVNELTPITFTVSATDPDIPANTITLTCSNCASLGASFNPATGVFSWTPTESQGPGTYTLLFAATDNGAPPLSDTRSVTIIVNEVNTAPVLSAPTSITATVNSTVTFQVSATDGDLPANTVVLNATGLVTGMSFTAATGNPVSGNFTFSPSPSQKGSTFVVTFTATDNGLPVLTSTKNVTITVIAAPSYALTVSNHGKVFRYQNGTFTLIGQPVTTALRSIAWKPDGSYALISGDSAVLLKYDGTQLTTITTGIPTSSNFWTVSWRPDGQYALIGGSSGLLLKYNGTTITTVTNPFSATILYITWHPSGSYALIVGRSGLALTYDGSIIRSISSGVTGDLDTAAWNPNGQYALIGGASGIVLRYDGTQISPVNTAGLIGTNIVVRSIAFDPTGSLALLAGDNGVVLTYNGSALTLIPAVASSALYSISWSGSTAYIAGGTGTILSYTGGVLRNLPSNTTASFRAIAWKPVS